MRGSQCRAKNFKSNVQIIIFIMLLNSLKQELEEWKEMTEKPITNPTPMTNEYIYDTAPSLALARKIITSFIVNVKERPEYLSTKDD